MTRTIPACATAQTKRYDPAWGDFWRREFASIVPAYHMNKLHWSGIILDGTVDEDVIRRMITDSYDLTAPHMKKKYTEEF